MDFDDVDQSRAIGLTVSTEVDPDVAERIGEGLDQYNISQAGPVDREAIWVVGRETDGSVQAGLKGGIAYSWLYVDWLWVSAGRRGQGIGSRLMEAAEGLARSRGCTGVYLQTATFQAPEFYRRREYVEFGRIDDFPPGHALLWLRKRI